MLPQRTNNTSRIDDNELTAYSIQTRRLLLSAFPASFIMVNISHAALDNYFSPMLESRSPIYPHGFIGSQHALAHRLCLLPIMIIIFDITMRIHWLNSKWLLGTSFAYRAKWIVLVVIGTGFMVYLVTLCQIYYFPLPLLIWQLRTYACYSKFHGQLFKIMKQDKKLGFIAINHYLCKLFSTKPMSNLIPYHTARWKKLNEYLDDALLSDKKQDVDQIISKIKNLMYFGLNRYLYKVSMIVICLVANINLFTYVYLNGHFRAYCFKLSMEICVCLLILINISCNRKLKTLFIRGWDTSCFNGPYYSRIAHCIDRIDLI